MPDELSELQENAERGRENPSLAPISVTMAILAVCVAVVSLLGHRAHTEEIVSQARASDQWSYYQAKNIRRHNYEMGVDLLALVEFKDKAQADKVREKYQKEAERYTKEQAEIEVLEIALVISSLALLSRKRFYWVLGIISGLAGLGVAATGFLLH